MALLSNLLSAIIAFWIIYWAIFVPIKVLILPITFHNQNPPNKDLVCTEKYDWFSSNHRFENCFKTENKVESPN